MSIWLATMMVILTIVVLGLVTMFLYKNFYQTLTQTKEIIVLREKVAFDSINMEKFNSIVDKLTKKTAPKEINDVVSPFR